MANISQIQLPSGDTFDLVDKQSGYITGMTILSYGNSTWQDFINAYGANKVVYCRASSNSNPATGSQTRLAFMAYVNNGDSPTNVEFQYYRSVSSHSDSQQGDQVYVYKLDKSNGWSVTVRESYSKIAVSGDLSKSYSSGTITLSADIPSTAAEVGAVATTSVGSANGVAPLGNNSLIDEQYLPITELAQAEYNDLTPEEKNNGNVYFITDGDPVSPIYKNGVQYGGPVVPSEYSNIVNSTNIAADSTALGARISLPVGIYIVTGEWHYTSTGATACSIGLAIGTSSDYYNISETKVYQPSAWYQTLNTSMTLKLTSATTVYVRGFCSIARNGCWSRIDALKIA